MKFKSMLAIALVLMFLAGNVSAADFPLDDMTVTLGEHSDDYENEDDTSSLDITIGDDFYIFILLEPDDDDNSVDIVIDVYFDDYLILEEYQRDNLDLDSNLEDCEDCLITLDQGDFDDIWEDLFLAYECGGHDIRVKVYDGDLDDDYTDTADLDIDGDEFDTVTMEPEDPDVEQEITIYVEDEDGDEMDDAYVKLYHLGDDDEWDDRDDDYYEKTDRDGESKITLDDEFDPAIGKYLIIVVERSSGGSFCRWSRTFSVKKVLKITEMPSDIRAGEDIQVRIVDANDNPVSYADVTISGPGGYRTTKSTDLNGYAILTVNESGSFSIVASKEEFDDSVIKNFEVKQRSGISVEIVPKDALVGSELTIKVTSNGKALEDAGVKIKKPDGLFEITKRTSSNGEIKYTPESTGTYEAEVSKQTYETATKKFTVFNQFVVTLESNVAINEYIPVTVKDQNSDAVNGATVSVGGIKKATTDSAGVASFTIDKSGKHIVGISKEGFKDWSKEVTAEGSLTAELSETEIELGDSITISVKDMKDEAIEADIIIDKPDGDKDSIKSAEYLYEPENAGAYTVTVSKTGYASSTADFNVLPYEVKITVEIVGNYLVTTVTRDNIPVGNLTISVKPPESGELFMYTDSEGRARLDLEELNEKGNFTIGVDEVNYESDTVVRDIEGWGGFDLMSMLLMILVVIIVVIVVTIAYVYSKGKGGIGKIGGKKKPKGKGGLDRRKKGTKLGGLGKV